MAAIEKICEYSGNYTGPEMYKFKRNHIQIEPQYRRNFRGFKSRLDIKIIGYGLKDKFGISMFYEWEKEYSFYSYRYEDVPYGKQNFEEWLRYHFKKRPVAWFEYSLTVLDDTWKSPTEQKTFYETTYDNPKHVIRKIKKMVGSKNLEIVKHY